MHGAWGALNTLIKKQESAKFRKTKLKHELQKRKESLLNTNATQELEFPEVSKSDMKILKEQIRKKYRAERVRNIIINILILFLILFLFYYLFSVKK